MKKILYLSSSLGSDDSGGGYLSIRILESLRKIPIYKIISVNVDKKININSNYNSINEGNKLDKLLNLISPLSNGWNIFKLIKVLKLIKKYNIDIVWLDSSMMGFMGAIIKIKYPKIMMITFYHNSEKFYYKEQSRFDKISYIFYLKALYSEYLIGKYSDGHIFLTNYDRDQHVINSSISCVISPIFEKNIIHNSGSGILFIGTPNSFNKESVDFIIKNIAPMIIYNINIVGISVEQYGSNTIPKNVNFSGWVENLDDVYNNCSLVLAPVFSGSGIKIKVGEAASKGKLVICSPHSAIGYDDLVEEGILIVCKSPSEYINAINENFDSQISFEKYNNFMKKFSNIEFNNNIINLINNIYE